MPEKVFPQPPIQGEERSAEELRRPAEEKVSPFHGNSFYRVVIRFECWKISFFVKADPLHKIITPIGRRLSNHCETQLIITLEIECDHFGEDDSDLQLSYILYHSGDHRSSHFKKNRVFIPLLTRNISGHQPGRGAPATTRRSGWSRWWEKRRREKRAAAAAARQTAAWPGAQTAQDACRKGRGGGDAEDGAGVSICFNHQMRSQSYPCTKSGCCKIFNCVCYQVIDSMRNFWRCALFNAVSCIGAAALL